MEVPFQTFTRSDNPKTKHAKAAYHFSSDDCSAGPFRELVRQQWNFSPSATTREVEEYCVELSDVAVVELTIVSNISSGGTAVPIVFESCAHYCEKRSAVELT